MRTRASWRASTWTTGARGAAAAALAGAAAARTDARCVRSTLVFERMLGLGITYIAAPTFTEMYLSLRSGFCGARLRGGATAPRHG
jgi:hypothetical protein